jgi:hypothetical protein
MKKSMLSVAKELGGTGGVAGISSDKPDGGNTCFLRQHEQSQRKRFELFITKIIGKREREERKKTTTKGGKKISCQIRKRRRVSSRSPSDLHLILPVSKI